MKNLVGNSWTDSKSEETLLIRNPYTNQIIDSVPNSTFEDVNEIVNIAHKFKKRWTGVSINERCRIMLRFCDIVSEKSDELAKILTSETGKNIISSKEEIDNLLLLVKAFVEKIKHMYGDVIPAGLTENDENTIQITSREPIGIVAAILPYSFPVGAFAHKVPAALLMGNVVIVKPSSKAPLTVTKLVYYLRLAGVPEGVVQLLHGTGDKTGHALAMHPDIQLITFSGSTASGMRIMEDASKNLTKVLLELSGNDAMIVCSDADIELAITEAIKGRIYNMGQSPSATKRFLIHKSKKDAFVLGLIEKISTMKYGDPSNNLNELTCLINEDAAIKVENQVKKMVDNGAKIVYGGRRNKNYYEPTIIIDVKSDMSVASKDEILGPVIPIIEYEDINQAIAIVNASPFGMAASIFTQNIKTAFKVAKCLECGTIIINGHTNYRSNEMAYGGWKYSGFGTEGVSSTLEQLSLVKTTVLKNVLE